jgi:hypothetical protein
LCSVKEPHQSIYNGSIVIVDIELLYWKGIINHNMPGGKSNKRRVIMKDELIHPLSNNNQGEPEETDYLLQTSINKQGIADRFFFLWGLLITLFSICGLFGFTNGAYKHPPDSSDLPLYALAFVILSCFLVLGLKPLIRGIQFKNERSIIRIILSIFLALLLLIVIILTYAIFYIFAWIIFTVVHLLLILLVCSEIRRLRIENYPVKLEIAVNVVFTIWFWFLLGGVGLMIAFG